MNETTAALLEVDDLVVRYGEVSAVVNVALRIRRGSIVTIIGPNGAGKTTLLESLMGLLPASGSVRYEGHDIVHASVADRVERGIALVPESRDLFADMSVRENLVLGSFSRHRRGERHFAPDLDEVFALFPRLKERINQRAGTLSGGERQMLAIGRALMGKPRLLMLDEPSLGLAPLIVEDIFRVVERLRETGVSILLVEQNARAALAASDYGYVLEMGHVVHQGPSADLIDDPRLTQAYLGIEAEPSATPPSPEKVMNPYRIALIVGSLRKASWNRKVAEAVKSLSTANLDMQFVEIGDLPLYNEDLDKAAVPEAWTRFRTEMAACDGVLFFAPEYNRSIPGCLKNAIDVGSRPYGKSIWSKKPAAVISAANGAIGGFGANQALRQTMVFLDVPVMQQPEAYIGGVAKLFDESGQLANEDTRKFLTDFVTAFDDWTQRLARR